MPIITIQVIEGVVLTSPEQKRELLKKMTDTFISVVGDVARPYTYCIIQELLHMSGRLPARRSPIYLSCTALNTLPCMETRMKSCAISLSSWLGRRRRK